MSGLGRGCWCLMFFILPCGLLSLWIISLFSPSWQSVLFCIIIFLFIFYARYDIIIIISKTKMNDWLKTEKRNVHESQNYHKSIRVRAALYFILCMLHIVCLTDCAVCNAEFVWYYMLLYLTSPAKKCFYLFLSILKKNVMFYDVLITAWWHRLVMALWHCSKRRIVVTL